MLGWIQAAMQQNTIEVAWFHEIYIYTYIALADKG